MSAQFQGKIRLLQKKAGSTAIKATYKKNGKVKTLKCKVTVTAAKKESREETVKKKILALQNTYKEGRGKLQLLHSLVPNHNEIFPAANRLFSRYTVLSKKVAGQHLTCHLLFMNDNHR